MPHQLFHDLFPERAGQETRSITVSKEIDSDLPEGDYGFLEMFCNERGCDCRRVMFYIISSHSKDERVEAVIAWGWESCGFYKKWLRSDDPQMVAELQGPVLNIGSPQSELAPALLNLVRDVLLQDPAYVERVKEHYWAFRNKVEGRNIVDIKRRRRSPLDKKHIRRV
jgi:hypothetical protein